jgi:hypothetical protein
VGPEASGQRIARCGAPHSVTEALNVDGEEFGEDRLKDVLDDLTFIVVSIK